MKTILSYLSICAGLCFALFLFVPLAQGQQQVAQEAELPPLAAEPFRPSEEPATMIPSRRVISPENYGYSSGPRRQRPESKPEKPLVRVYSLKDMTGDALTISEHPLADPFIEPPPTRNRLPRPLNPLYALCIRMLKDTFSESKGAKMYEIADKTAVVFVAPQSVHEDVVEMIKELEDMCKTLRKLENEETAPEPASVTKAESVSKPQDVETIADLLKEIEELRKSIGEIRNLVGRPPKAVK